jgi:pyruvate dehydrogenase E2 component (dihydrolipoamide acetyltransferase)
MAEVVNMPKLGFDMAEGTLVRWVKAEGESIERGEVLAEIETDKATVEVESQATGVILKLLASEGAILPIGDPIAVVGEAGEDVDIEALVVESAAEAPGDAAGEGPQAEAPKTELSKEPAAEKGAPAGVGDDRFPGGVMATPVARRIAEERDFDLRRLSGSGPRGRIVKADVERALASGAPAPAFGAGAGIRMADLGPRQTERTDISRLRGAIGRRMTASKQQLPHFYLTADINAGPMMDLRAQANELMAEDQKLSVNDFIVKAVGLSLRDFPNLNASLDEGQIVRHGPINVGVAVAVEGGLMTVVVRDADRKSVQTISQEVREMAGRARSGRVRPEDIEGSTFTVSNLGMFDVDHFIAIINPPEAAILATGSVMETPVVEDGKVVIGQRIKATVSADHRITDGAEAARWLQSFRKMVEAPLGLLL